MRTGPSVNVLDVRAIERVIRQVGALGKLQAVPDAGRRNQALAGESRESFEVVGKAEA